MKEFSYKEPRYFIDVETISKVDIKKHGAVRYAEDPSTFITILHIYDKTKDEHHTLVDPRFMSKVGEDKHEFQYEAADRIEDILIDIVDLKEAFSAHNILFEHVILKNCIHKLYGNIFNDSNMHIGTPEQWDKAAVYGTCTKDLAIARGYKRSKLEELSESLKLDDKGKDMLGHNLMLIVCKYYGEDKIFPALDKAEKLLGNYNLGTSLEGVVRGKEVSRVMMNYCKKDVVAAYEVWKRDLSSKRMIHSSGNLWPIL